MALPLQKDMLFQAFSLLVLQIRMAEDNIHNYNRQQCFCVLGDAL